MNINLYSREEAAEWNAALAGIPHDIYQTAEFHLFESANGEGEPFAFVADRDGERLIWPYLRKPVFVPGGEKAISDLAEVRSCYGYPGPVCTPNPSDAFVTEALKSLLTLWKDEGIVNAFTRLHPVLENHRIAEWTDRLEAGSQLVCHGKTVSIDLRVDAATRFDNYASAVRNGIRKNHRNGLRTIVDTDFRYLDDFCRFYEATMDRNRASTYYYFSRDYFERLIAHQRGAIHLFVTLAGDVPACTGLYSAYQRQMQALFFVNNPECTKMAPSRTLLHDVSDWGQANAFTDHHLGGGRGGAEDSLFEFKASFSDLHRPFYTHRLIVNETEYRRLTALRASRDPLPEDESYFPAWRKPLPVAALAH